MKQQIADIMDVVILVLFLAFCMANGISAVIQSTEELNAYEVNYEDKTAFTRYTLMSKAYGTYDGTLTADELILMTQIQDDNMPYSQVYNFCDETEVTSLSNVPDGTTITTGKQNTDASDLEHYGEVQSWYVHSIKTQIPMIANYRNSLSTYSQYARDFMTGDDTKNVSYSVDYNYETNAFDIHKVVRTEDAETMEVGN